MTKTGKSFKRFLSLALCTVLSLGVFLNFPENAVSAAETVGSRNGETYVHVDDFDTYTEDDAKHYKFFGRENGAFNIEAFTVGNATDNGVTIDANGANALTNAYNSAVLINANPTINQYVRVDFTKASTHPMAWVRANIETLEIIETTEDPETSELIETKTEVKRVTGYFVYWDATGYFRLYKAEIKDNQYVITQLARCDQFAAPGTATYFLGMEICAVGANPTVLTVKTYKNTNTNGTKAYTSYGVQTITDDTASLQKKGTPALSSFGTTQVLKFVYNSDDGVKPNTYLKNTSAKTGVNAGTVLTVKQNTEYEFSYITDKTANESDNDPVFLKYVTEDKDSGTNYYALGDINNFSLTRNEYKGYNRFSGTFSLNNTDYANIYYSYNNIAWSEDADKLNHINVPIVVGFALNNATVCNSKYKEFAVREVFTDNEGNKTYGPNLIVNGNFTLGAYNWSSELKIGRNIGNNNSDHFNGVTGVELLDDTGSRYTPPNGRLTVHQESNSFDYHYGFLYDPDTALWGDANSDGEIDILDLVRAKKIVVEISDYCVFADLSSYNAKLENEETDGVISAEDLTELRLILLNGSKKKYLVSLGNQYLSKTLEPQTIALKTSIKGSQTEISANDKTVYYVSSSGSDDNNGLSEDTPFKSIDKINSLGANLKNSVICFKRGETFRGNIIAQAGITYTAYGTGDKPVIMGSPENGADSSKWELVSGTENIYKYATSLKDVGAIIFNEGENYATKLCPHIKNGVYTYSYDALENGEFISIVTDSSVTDITNYDSYKNLAVNTLYLRCDSGNPGEVYSSIEFNTYGYGISGIVPYVDSEYVNENITVDNLDIRYTGGHGIGFSSAENLTVQNCEISYIGGAIISINSSTDTGGNTYYYASRYGNGVEVTGWCDGYAVKNCYIHDIYDAGITHQNGSTAYTIDREYNNIEYSGNLIENCCYSIEYFSADSTNGVNTTTMKNVTISDNIMRNAGVGFCEQRIANDSETSDGKRGFNYGSHINSWYSNANKSENFEINNNVFDCTVYHNSGRIKSGLLIITAKEKSYLPTFAGNTYIQHFDENFASFGLCDSKLVWDAVFDVKAKGFLKTTLGDLSGSVYYVD